MSEHEVTLTRTDTLNEWKVQCSCGAWQHGDWERIAITSLAHLHKGVGQYERREFDGVLTDVVSPGPLVLTARLP